MIRKAVALAVLFCAAPVSYAGLSLVGEFEGPAGTVGTLYLHSDADGAYMCWLEITDPGIAMFAGEPSFTEAGNPNGDSTATYWPQYGEWYSIMVASLDPDDPIRAGDHVAIDVVIVSCGETSLYLYAEDGVTLLDCARTAEVPEPATVVLLGVGVVCAHCRNWKRSVDR